MTRETEYLLDGLVVVVVLDDRLVSFRDDTELVVLDTVVGYHENVGGNAGGNEGDKEEKAIKGSADDDITSRLEAPCHRRVIHNQRPREVRFGRGGQIDKIESQGVRRKSVKDTIAVEVVVVIVDIELNRRGPSIHDVELPLSVVILRECRRDALVVAELVEFSAREETGDSAEFVILEICAYDTGGRTCGRSPI